MQSGEFFVRELDLTVLKQAEEEQCTCMLVYLSSDYVTSIYISFINQAVIHNIYIYSLDIFFIPECKVLPASWHFSLFITQVWEREVFGRLSLQGEYVWLWYFLSRLSFVTYCSDLFCRDDKEYILSSNWLCCL